MYSSIPKIPTHPRHKYIHLFLSPAQTSRQQRKAEAFEPFQDIRLIPLAQRLHERILRPPIRRPHKHLLLDVHEPGVRHPRKIVVGTVASHGSAELACGFAEEFAPF